MAQGFSAPQAGNEQTLQSLIADWEGRGAQPALIAIQDGGRDVWSYAELAETVRRLAAGLLRDGLCWQEPVALLGPNSPAWIASYFAIVAAGAIVVPFDYQLPADQLARLLRHSGCRRIFTTAAAASRLTDLNSNLDLQIVSLDQDTSDASRPRSWKTYLAEPDRPLPALLPEAPAALLYTSGTTGAPKGVLLSHANIIANVIALAEQRFIEPGGRVVLPLPLHHAYPFTVGLLGTFASGGALILPAGRTGPQLLSALHEPQVKVLLGVPRLYDALLATIENRLGTSLGRLLSFCVWLQRRFRIPLGRAIFAPLRRRLGPDLRILGSGGAKLAPDVAWKLAAMGWQVLTGYGLTETAPVLSFNPPGRARLGTAGRPILGVQLKIEAPSGKPFGEVLAKGPNVFDGYWNSPELTAAAFTEDGWFRTGDLGFLDDDGYLHLVGRAKELIVLPNGENVFPEDVEAVYGQCPVIQEIGVFEMDGRLAALVVPEEEALRARGAARIETLIREELDLLAPRLRSYERVAALAITRKALPRNLLGKLRRFLLPELFAELSRERRETEETPPLSDADRVMLADPLAKEVWDWLAERYPARPLRLDDSPQLDLGVDSLGWVDLTLEIADRFHRNLTEAAIGRILTLRDLLREIAQAAEAAVAVEEAAEVTPTGPVERVPAVLLYGLNWLLMRVLFRLRVVGQEHLPPSGAYLLTPNHCSYLDPLALAAALPFGRLRTVFWAGWRGILFTTRMRRLFSRITQVFPVDPERAGVSALAAAQQVLARNHALVWFPEGRRSPDGSLQPFSPGVGMVITKTGAVTVPVRIFGAFEALPRGRFFPRLTRITVAFGPPLPLEALVPPGRDADNEQTIADSLRNAVADLSPS